MRRALVRVVQTDKLTWIEIAEVVVRGRPTRHTSVCLMQEARRRGGRKAA